MHLSNWLTKSSTSSLVDEATMYNKINILLKSSIIIKSYRQKTTMNDST